MTTVLDTKAATKLWPVVQKYGTNATFRTYPARTQDNDDGSVVLGTPVDYTVKVVPPDWGIGGEELSGGPPEGDDLLVESMQIILLTGNSTANAIAFTPERHMPVQMRGTGPWWHIEKLEPIESGDHIAAYEIDLVE